MQDPKALNDVGEFLHKSGQFFSDYQDIKAEIEAATDAETGSNKGISAKPINLKITSACVPLNVLSCIPPHPVIPPTRPALAPAPAPALVLPRVVVMARIALFLRIICMKPQMRTLDRVVDLWAAVSDQHHAAGDNALVATLQARAELDAG